MFLIITKDNTRYTVESIRHKENGIVFEHNGEEVLLTHDQIKSIDGSFKKASAKAYMKRRN